MHAPQTSISLVERKIYNHIEPHPITPDIWWVGCVEGETGESHNPYLLCDGDEAVLINPGSCAREHRQTVCHKIASIIPPDRIRHVVVHHDDPQRCAALPQVEKIAARDVRLYAPVTVLGSIKHYGCTSMVIPLDDGDSIILKSGRMLDYYSTPDLPHIGSGFLYDPKSGTIFCGNLFGTMTGDWNLFAPPSAWQHLEPSFPEGWGSKKALLYALNKIERLGPERICPQHGPIIEDEIDRYIDAACRWEPGK